MVRKAKKIYLKVDTSPREEPWVTPSRRRTKHSYGQSRCRRKSATCSRRPAGPAVFAGSCRRTSSGSSATLAGHHSRGVAQARWCHSGDGGCRRRAHQPGADSNANTLHVIAGRQRPPSPLAAYAACATRPSELAQGWRKKYASHLGAPTPARTARTAPILLRSWRTVGALLLKRHPDDFGPGVKASQ